MIMQILIWTLTLLVLALWSALAWTVHAVWNLLTTLPWPQVLAQLQAHGNNLPPWLEPWLGPVWKVWLDLLAAAGPALEALGGVLRGSANWLVDAMPVLLTIGWGVGALVLLILAAAASGVTAWLRRGPAAA
jgi:hypothetical protein